MTRLVILDLYGTLVKADIVDNIVRPGFQEFWEHYHKDHLFVVSTDGSKRGVKDTLQDSRLIDKLDGFYDEGHLEELGGQYLKNLVLICQNAGVDTKDTVFIGDNFAGRDENSAFYADIRFIQVPQYRDKLPSASEIAINRHHVCYEDPNKAKLFNFKSLIGRI